METLQSLFSEQVIEAFGWAIFHSIWQALLLVILLVVVLFFMKDYTARLRYFVAYSILITTLFWSVGTGVSSYNYAKEKQAIKERLINSEDGIASEIKIMLDENNTELNQKNKLSSVRWLEFKSKVQANFYVVFYLWLVGIVFFLVRMAGGFAALQRLARQKNTMADDKWIKLGKELQNKLGIKQKVLILQSYLAKVPMVVGKIKPVILIPVELLTGLSEEQIVAIIAHELAHIKRNDYLLNIIQSIVETLFFYHPAVWLMSRIIRDEREHSCDDLAVQITGDKLNYIKALASAQEFNLKTQYNAVAFAQSNGGLLTRVKRLKTMSNMKNKVTEGFFAAALIFVSIITLSFTYASAPRQLNENFNAIESSDKFSHLTPEDLSPENLKVVKDTLKKKVSNKVEVVEEKPEDLETIIELALSEKDDAISVEVLASVEQALKEIEWDEIQAEIAEAQAEIEALNMDSIMQEAQVEIEAELKELKAHEKELAKELAITEEAALEIAKEVLEAAAITLEAIQLDSIIEYSISTSLDVLKDMDIGDIIEDAMHGVDINFESDDKNQNLEELEKELDELENE